jgi:hypothetical protein
MIALSSPSPGAPQLGRPHKIVALLVELFTVQAASAALGEIERSNRVVQSPQGAGLVIIEGGIPAFGGVG